MARGSDTNHTLFGSPIPAIKDRLDDQDEQLLQFFADRRNAIARAKGRAK
ncbi:hypothetical protein [Paracoccus laeviglucosivorans]|uniref:Uncharacterized protein n=1 Tax=Paracoccus laeviglucosivorans TaxID=1197861 RepID=A0A521E5Y8_9RHOB|nr:hypothetical protein [Paracoccus laeviglucosivorans]SMO79356.1 hypothetical protein SAMN06265221_11176 [Paracoccus laeviglucosivorans]